MGLVEKLLAYYKENTEDFNNDIEQLDAWTGCLYDDRIYPMDELNEFFSNEKPDEIISRAFYGYDETYTKDEQRQPFNPNRNFFYFNGYGNLVSIDEVDYSDYLDNYFIQLIIDNSHNLYLSEGAEDIIDEYEYENE